MADERPDTQQVARAYDVWALQYDGEVNRTRDLAGDVLRGHDFALAAKDVLEIGCGTGRHTVWLAAGARSVIALDFSPGMLAEARRRVTSSTVRFVEHDIRERWPVEDASVDLVIGMLVLEHLDEIGPVFREAARVLRPGGTFFSAEFHPMRQMMGRQARFTDAATGRVELVAAFLHDTSEYVQSGLGAGMRLDHLGEWRDDEAERASTPRLISVCFVRP